MTEPVDREGIEQDDSDAERYAAVTAIDLILLDELLLAWALLDMRNAQASFVADVLPKLLVQTSLAQQRAASVAIRYALTQAFSQGLTKAPKISAQAFSGTAADGYGLVGRMSEPLIRTFEMATMGASPAQAKAGGARLLSSIGITETHDAARAAEFTAIAGNAEVAGYIRVVEPGACSRCILLAGKFYKWNSGFRRHPRCRCFHKLQTTTTEGQDPMEVFNSLSREEQDRRFTPASAQAIRDGADIYQVVNARMGMDEVTVGGRKVKATSAGTSPKSYTSAVRRAIAQERGDRYRRQPRLVPEEIVKQAKGDRAMTRRLLISNGYIVGDIKDLAKEVVRAANR